MAQSHILMIEASESSEMRTHLAAYVASHPQKMAAFLTVETSDLTYLKSKIFESDVNEHTRFAILMIVSINIIALWDM